MAYAYNMIYHITLIINHLRQVVTVAGNGGILIRRLFQAFFQYRPQQQQENWDSRSNSSVVADDYDMSPPPVFNGHVRDRGEVATCGTSKLKHATLKEKGVLI